MRISDWISDVCSSDLIGGQTFFDFLPGPFDGFGIQANYTYVDSSNPAIIPTELTPLPNLSKSSFNVAGLYENGGLSARVEYNYRSKYISGIYGLSHGAGVPPELLPAYAKGYGRSEEHTSEIQSLMRISYAVF